MSRFTAVARRLAPLATSLVLMSGCLDAAGAPHQLITVTGLVTDSVTTAPVPLANVAVEFGTCQGTCLFIGNPGTGHTDSTGHYIVQIIGSTSAAECNPSAYFVFVNAGTGYTVGASSFACGPTNTQLDFSLHPLKNYLMTGTVTRSGTATPIVGATVSVGLYAPGTSCLTTSCQPTTILSVATDAGGAYSLLFHGVSLPAECGSRTYLITVNSGPGYTGAESHVPCGQLATGNINFALQ